MDAATLKFIKDRLPADHGFTDPDIEGEYEAASESKYEALALLWERLAASDKYGSVSVGSMSYSNPLMIERARYWRSQGADIEDGTAGNSSITFIPATGIPLLESASGFGEELG